MKDMSNAKKALLKGISKAAKKSSLVSANTACVWWAYQPKMPKSVKKMRKF